MKGKSDLMQMNGELMKQVAALTEEATKAQRLSEVLSQDGEFVEKMKITPAMSSFRGSFWWFI